VEAFVAHVFLSDDWFAALEALAAEAPEPPAGAADIVLNLTVTEAPGGPVEAHLTAGRFGRDHIDGAPTKVIVPYEVAKEMLIQGNPAAAMQAFMSGRIKVEGDMSKLMAMQATPPTAEQQDFQRKVQALTA